MIDIPLLSQLPEAVQIIILTGIGAGARDVLGRVLSAPERRDAAEREAEAITAKIREELRLDMDGLRASLRETEAKLDKRDAQIETMRSEHFALMEKYATLVAESHRIRAENHQLRSYLAGLHARLQMVYRKNGLNEDELPALPSWLFDSSFGPTKTAGTGLEAVPKVE